MPLGSEVPTSHLTSATLPFRIESSSIRSNLQAAVSAPAQGQVSAHRHVRTFGRRRHDRSAGGSGTCSRGGSVAIGGPMTGNVAVPRRWHTTSARVTPPSISPPRGGGAIRGVDEKFTANPATGTLTVPLPISNGRSGFEPKLELRHDSDNGPFGVGWQLDLPTETTSAQFKQHSRRLCRTPPRRSRWRIQSVRAGPKITNSTQSGVACPKYVGGAEGVRPPDPHTASVARSCL